MIRFRVNYKGIDPNKVFSVETPRSIPGFVKSMLMSYKATVKATGPNTMKADILDGVDKVGEIEFIDVTL